MPFPRLHVPLVICPRLVRVHFTVRILIRCGVIPLNTRFSSVNVGTVMELDATCCRYNVPHGSSRCAHTPCAASGAGEKNTGALAI